MSLNAASDECAIFPTTGRLQRRKWRPQNTLRVTSYCQFFPSGRRLTSWYVISSINFNSDRGRGLEFNSGWLYRSTVAVRPRNRSGPRRGCGPITLPLGVVGGCDCCHRATRQYRRIVAFGGNGFCGLIGFDQGPVLLSITVAARK